MTDVVDRYPHGIICLDCSTVLEFIGDIWRRTTEAVPAETWNEDGEERIVELVCQTCFFKELK